MENLRIRLLYLTLLFAAVALCFSGCDGKDSKARMRMAMRNNPYKVTADDLLSVKALDTGHVWVVGSFGGIYFSPDDGKTWKKQQSKGNEQLCEVDFVDPQNGWIVGSNGTILNTADGGQAWNLQKSPLEKLFIKVDFFDKDHGWAVGEQGTFIRTADGGKTWQDKSIKYGPALNGVCFIDTRTGWIVGDYGSILRTDDGGETWQEQKCQEIIPVVAPDEWEQPMPMLYDVYFSDKNRGWVSGADGIILHTEDGGNLWKKLETNTKVKIYTIEINGSMGQAVGDKGIFVFSNDGGLTWDISIDAVKTRKWLRDVSLYGEQGGWIVGATGMVVKTDDAGKDWKVVSGKTYELPINKDVISNKKK